jgi:hydrogenase-4 component B
MPVVVLLWCVAALFVCALSGIAIGRRPGASQWVYGASLAACLVAFIAAAAQLVAGPPTASAVILPLGLPWLGAHFRIDPLAAFFLAVVNLGAAAASLYGLGYGRHEPAPHRVLPFFPAFLAAMNLVVLAHDAFTFLLSWELMSLVS